MESRLSNGDTAVRMNFNGMAFTVISLVQVQ